MAWAPSKTIGVDLWAGQARGAAPNCPTMVRPAVRMPSVHRSFRDLFIASYASFAERCRQVDEPGIALVAVHEATGRAQGIVTLRARVDRHVAAIVGRHDRCDMYLATSDNLALRHLAIILDPVASWRPGDASVRYRVLDLRTSEGFRDEQGNELRGLRCEGPALLRVAGYALFVLPLGDPSDWPASAVDAWSFLPERVYFDELAFLAEGSVPRLAPRNQPATKRKSIIMRTHGPRDTGYSLTASGTFAGFMDLRGRYTHGELRIGEHELADGVLLGRYPRCHSAGFSDDPSLSRVHALLLRIDDRLVVVDTASRNGTRLVGSDDARLITLAGDAELELGTSTRLRWRWVG